MYMYKLGRFGETCNGTMVGKKSKMTYKNVAYSYSNVNTVTCKCMA